MKDILQTLPEVIVEHIAAHNNHDPEAFMATLASDALVNDVRREFLGHDAIRAWADEEIFGANVTLDLQKAYEHHGSFILRCRVDGTFDKTNLPDPLLLTYYFNLMGGEITQLVIIHNKEAM